jgi:hypothetical protein
VKKATVSLPLQEASVTYDPKQTSVPALIKAVDRTPSMMGGGVNYGATVHKEH